MMLGFDASASLARLILVKAATNLSVMSFAPSELLTWVVLAGINNKVDRKRKRSRK